MLTDPYANTRGEMLDDTVTMVDYTNLYIKNLDHEVTSKTLFELFRVFGEIISARVMKDTLTNVSRGYGFVSFKQMEDAHNALIQMNGFRVNTKSILVSFHEHKKQTQQKIRLDRNYPAIRPTIKNNPVLHPAPCISPEQKPWQETIWMHPSNAYSMQMPVVSPMTTPTSIQEHKLREVIKSQLLDHQKKDLNELVDLIQSLNKRELSLCLFNPTFLRQQLDKAYEIIHLFKENTTSITTTPSLDHRQLEEDNDSVMAILSSLEGLNLNKKKRILGDILFPLVKATGIRHAPKVTIQLLDTVPVDELVFNMYNKTELAKKAYQAYIEIHEEASNPFRKCQ